MGFARIPNSAIRILVIDQINQTNQIVGLQDPISSKDMHQYCVEQIRKYEGSAATKNVMYAQSE